MVPAALAAASRTQREVGKSGDSSGGVGLERLIHVLVKRVQLAVLLLLLLLFLLQRSLPLTILLLLQRLLLSPACPLPIGTALLQRMLPLLLLLRLLLLLKLLLLLR